MPIRRTEGGDEEWAIPPITTSPITGVLGATAWGALNKFNTGSRQVIADSEADELINFLPQLSGFQQVPGPGPLIATLAAATIWGYTDILNGNLFSWYLCTNGHIYQVSTGGTITDLGAGFATGTNQCDITLWQGTNILINDFVAQKIYNWNGSVLATVFSSQPEKFIAVYSGRLWMSNGLVITWTNAGTFNSLGGDSGSYIVSDGHNNNPVIGLRDFNGSLYVFGSNWIKTINNLNDIGTPAVLTFQQPTLQSQVSIINKWSIVEWGQSLFFANIAGFWRLDGAVPTKISDALDGYFQNIDPASSFTGAYTRIYNMECVLWQARWTVDGNYCAFGYTKNGQWFRVIPANSNLKMITGAVSSAITNNQPIVYYNDGTNIYDLFGSTSATVTSTFNSKIWSFYSIAYFDMFTEFFVQFVIFGPATLVLSEIDSNGVVSGPAIPAGSLTYSYNPSVGQWVNNFGVTGQWVNNVGVAGNWQGTSTATYVLEQAVIPYQERNMGVNLVFTGSGIVLQAMVVTYRKLQTAKG